MINHLPKQQNRQIPFVSEDSSGLANQTALTVTTADSMKTKTEANNCWQSKVADVITDIDQLLTVLDLSNIKSKLYVPESFGLRVPKGFVDKMERGNANDPLLMQVLPSQLENLKINGYVSDPLAENEQNPIQGLLHKYHSRVLVTVTGACAIHCRYCFRQHFDYQENLPKSEQLEQIKSYIINHPEIKEVLLSGGDPLSLSDRRLFLWLEAIEELSQISTIRIHTRMPIVVPERLQQSLLSRLAASRCQIVMVVHTNHANEIDTHTAQHLLQAKQYSITLLNQTVLLAGINDTLEVQVALNERLFEAGVLPYYLHLLDKVEGAAHFDLDRSRAVHLYWKMLEHLPGYLVPKLVQELPNKPFKTPVDLYQH